MPRFYLSVQDPNSGPHVCSTNHFTHSTISLLSKLKLYPLSNNPLHIHISWQQHCIFCSVNLSTLGSARTEPHTDGPLGTGLFPLAYCRRDSFVSQRMPERPLTLKLDNTSWCIRTSIYSPFYVMNTCCFHIPANLRNAPLTTSM